MVCSDFSMLKWDVHCFTQTARFNMMELQAKWISLVLSGKVLLPSKEKMLADTQEYYKLMHEQGIAKHHTHSLFRLKVTFVYLVQHLFCLSFYTYDQYMCPHNIINLCIQPSTILQLTKFANYSAEDIMSIYTIIDHLKHKTEKSLT